LLSAWALQVVSALLSVAAFQHGLEFVVHLGECLGTTGKRLVFDQA